MKSRTRSQVRSVYRKKKPLQPKLLAVKDSKGNTEIFKFEKESERKWFEKKAKKMGMETIRTTKRD